MAKNRNYSSRKYPHEGGLTTNAIPLPNTPNGMNFSAVEQEQYFRIVEDHVHEDKEPALPSEPIGDLLGLPAGPSRDWAYEMKLQHQVEPPCGGRFIHRPVANRKELNERYGDED